MFEADANPLRALSAWEQAFHYYEVDHPCQFCVAADLSAAVTREALADALAGLQRVHPLLRARVDAGATGSRAFEPAQGPIPLRLAAAGTRWEDVAADEQVAIIDPTHGPLVRATLIQRAQAATVVLTFDHRIADGAAGLRVLEDLVALLNGNHLPARAVPAPQEELIGALASPLSGPQPEAGSSPDPRLTAPGRLSSPDGSRPQVTTAELDEATTARLVQACHDRAVTVHAALCAAATQALVAAGRDYVRIVSPKDLRRIGLEDDVALRLLPSRTGSSRDQAVDFWPLAHATAEAIAPTRSVESVKQMSEMIASQPVTDAAAGAAGMIGASSLDMMLTNLGQTAFAASGPVEVTAIYGLAMVVGFVDEQILGVTTFRDRLRMTNVTHSPIPGLLDAITERLLAATGHPAVPAASEPG